MPKKKSSISKLLASELADKCAPIKFYKFLEDMVIWKTIKLHALSERIGTIGGGTSEIMREILAKMIIDDVSYGKPKSDNSQQTTVEHTVESIFKTLPARFKAEKAKGKELSVLFEIEDEKNRLVQIKDGKLILSTVDSQPSTVDIIIN